MSDVVIQRSRKPTASCHASRVLALGGSAVSIHGAGVEGVLGVLAPFGHASVDANTGVVAEFELASIADCGARVDMQRDRPVVLHQRHAGSMRCDRTRCVVFNATVGTHYHVDTEHGLMIRVCLANDTMHLVDAIQVVRGLLLYAELARGCIPIHGACFTVGGRGVLLVGDKGAGKTSFLLSALQRFSHAGLVTNDKGLWSEAESRLTGLPYAAGVAPETLCRVGPMRGDRWSGGKLMLWPQDVARSLSVPLVPDTAIDEAWICRINPAQRDACFLPCDDATKKRARRELVGFPHTVSPVWLYQLLGWPLPRRQLPIASGFTWRVLEGNPWDEWRDVPDCCHLRKERPV